MAVNFFIGWPQKDLEAALLSAQEDLAAGKTISDASSGDVSKREQVSKSIESRIKMLLQALTLVNPDQYPPSQTFSSSSYKVVFSPNVVGDDPNQA